MADDNFLDSSGRPLESPRPVGRPSEEERAAAVALSEARMSSMMEDVDFRRDLMSQLGYDPSRLLPESPYSSIEAAVKDPLLAVYFPPPPVGSDFVPDLRREDHVYLAPSVEDDQSILAHEFRHRGSRELMDQYGLRGASFNSPEVQSFIENYGLAAYDTLMGDNEYLVELFDRHPDTPLQIDHGAEGLPEGLTHMGDTLDEVYSDALINRENTGYFSEEGDRMRAALDPELVSDYLDYHPNSARFYKPTRELSMDDAYTGLNRASRDALMDQGRYNPQPGDIRPRARPYLPRDVDAQERHLEELLKRVVSPEEVDAFLGDIRP